jgi:hypothetical protein
MFVLCGDICVLKTVVFDTLALSRRNLAEFRWRSRAWLLFGLFTAAGRAGLAFFDGRKAWLESRLIFIQLLTCKPLKLPSTPLEAKLARQ